MSFVQKEISRHMNPLDLVKPNYFSFSGYTGIFAVIKHFTSTCFFEEVSLAMNWQNDDYETGTKNIRER